MRCLLRTGLFNLILSFSLLSDVATATPRADTPFLPPQIPLNGPSSRPDKLEFTLRHVYHQGTNGSQQLHRRIDVRPDTRLMVIDEDGTGEQLYDPTIAFAASSKPLTIQRLADRRVSVMKDHLRTARSAGSAASLSPSAWVMDTVEGPNVADKETILNFAKMTANDYIEVPGTEDWHDIHGRFNYSNSFGWASDGLRGHIYADKTNETIVISLKGTSAALFDGEGTTTNDKENDNLFFSCCCGQGGSYLWRQVCDCQTSAFTANLTCIVEALTDDTRYYKMAIDLYANVTELYPHANVWLTGHSLGGAMASLLGQTFGLPVVTYEAVPEALPAARLGLPAPPGHDPRLPQSRRYTGVYHIGHTADPVYMGTCNGVGSVCTWGGYAMESACHSGEMCVYDTVEDKGWRVAIGTHRIRAVIKDVIDKYDEVPPCAREEECYDCELWKFFRSNGSELTTTRTRTSTTSRTTTRSTSTCKTPGWWGCLDETTTTGATTKTSSTSTSTTTSCKTPGWFGCKDPTTTTTKPPATPAPSITTTVPTATRTSCLTPGWLGCRDHTATKSLSQSTPQVTSSTCETPGIFFGCWDPSTTETPSVTSAPTSRSSSSTSTGHDSHSCTSKAFFGLICLDLT